MTHQVLSNCLKPIIHAENRWRKRRVLTAGLGMGAILLFSLAILARFADWWSTPLALGILTATFLFLAIALFRINSSQLDLRSLARRVESEHPDLNSALLTAMDMEPRPDGKLGFLQSQVLREVTEHAIRHRWVRQVSEKKLARFGWFQLAAGLAFFLSLGALVSSIPTRPSLVEDSSTSPESSPTKTPRPEIQIKVQPGNVEVEKGSRVIVEASFEGRLPTSAIVVLTDPKDGSEAGRLSMRAGVDDSVFSAVVSSVDRPLDYVVRFEDASSDRFSITTYTHPELERADATITPPVYTALPEQKIEDTRKISVLEGSNVAWEIKVSKPVQQGELFGEDRTSIELKPRSDDPTILVASHVPKETQKYRLHLIDDKERSNKLPPWFTVAVKKNQPPRLEFTFPQRDVEITNIEELTLEAQIWDDLGVQRAGIVFEHKEQQKEIILASESLQGDKKHKLNSRLAIEELGAQPRDLITYHLWAEDLDAEGKVRRTQSDMYLAEVRHFEDIFRESASQGGQQQGGEQGQSSELLKLQKDILNAAWKNLRTAQISNAFTETLREAVSVVHESQEINIQKTSDALEESEDPELKSYLEEARQHMETAAAHFLKPLEISPTTPATAGPVEALQLGQTAAKKAYESLLKARTREHNVSLSQSPSQGGQPQDREKQLMNLELKQKELKYKENSAAQTAEEAQRQQENLEVLNKLKELARRQEAIAEKIKELQTQLEEAKSEEDKEQIRRQLKRLQEEQEELLRELDDLSQRMDSEENRPNMAEERKKLEETRQNLRDSAKSLENQELSDAANSATRAERDLKETEDEFRKKTSRQFADEMKNVRSQARELAEKQKEISNNLDDIAPENTNSGNPFRSSEENHQLSQTIADQQDKLGELLSDLRKISEDAAESEPLLSDALYDAVRESIVNDVENSLAEASRMLRRNHRTDAREPQQNAAQGIEDLKNRVEKAAEKILGSEADSLRLARAELDRLIEQSSTEANRIEGKAPDAEDQAVTDQSGNKGREEGNEDGKGEGKDDPQLAQGKEKGKGQGQESPDQPADGKGKGEGEKGREPGENEAQTAQEGTGKGQDPGAKGKGENPGQEQNAELAQDGKGTGKGKGQSPSEEQNAELAQDGKGTGKGKGQSPGQEQSAELAQGGKGKAKGKSEGDGVGQEQQPGEAGEGGQGKGDAGSQAPQRGSLLARGPQNRRAAGSNFGGDDRGGQLPTDLANQPPLFFNNPQQESTPQGPITGEEYKDFANALGNIEEMLPRDDLRNDIAKVLDDARAMRIDYRRDNLPPGAAQIRQKIVNPLVELRSRVSEELAKLNKENPIAPIDRDPVPGEFRELVRKYYEQLGSGNN